MSNYESLPFNFYFKRESVPSIQDVVEVLQGTDAIIRRMPKILTDFMDIPITSVSVDVASIKSGSLYDDLIVKFGFGGKEQMDLFLKDMHDKFMTHKIVPVLLFLALLSAGGFTAAKFFSKDEASVAPVIDSYNTTIINIIASDIDKNPEAVRAIIAKAIPNTESIKLARDSFKVFNAVRSAGDSLTLNNDQDHTISPAFLNELPKNLDLDAVEEIREVDNVEVNLRAIDIDSMTKGWAAIIPALGQKRIKVQVASGVNITEVPFGTAFKANIRVVYKNKNDSLIPSYCILKSIVQ